MSRILFRQTARSGALLAALTLSACVSFRSRPKEQRTGGIEGERFKSLAVVAVGDNSSQLSMTSRVRKQVQDAGVSIATASGSWGGEADAVADVCARPVVPKPDGILFVTWDNLRLYDCQSRSVAYNVDGGYAGVEEMTKYLLRYLRRGPPAQ